MKTASGLMALLLIGCGLTIAPHNFDCATGLAGWPDCGVKTPGHRVWLRQQAQRASANGQIAARDEQQCQSSGATPETDGYLNCRVVHLNPQHQAAVPVPGSAAP